MQSARFSISFNFCILFAVLVFLVPTRFLLSWFVAAGIHELSHLIALRLFRVRIYSLTIGFSGAVMQTQPMDFREEIICAFAGPLGGLTTILLLRIFPHVTLFGLVQSIFNLLPVYPLDGGRIVRRILQRYCSGYANLICMVIKAIVIVFGVGIFIFLFRAWQIILLVPLLYLVKRKGLKFPCKASEQIVQ